MANITFAGRIGKDPELKTSQAGKEYVRLSVAWQERQKDRTGEWVDGPTMWVSVTAFGRQAGNLVASLKKGDHVTVTGRIQPESWSSDQGEQTVLVVTADSVAPTLFFQRVQVGKDDPQGGGGFQQQAPQQSQGGFQQQSAPQAQQPDPWGQSAPQGGFSNQGNETPPF